MDDSDKPIPPDLEDLSNTLTGALDALASLCMANVTQQYMPKGFDSLMAVLAAEAHRVHDFRFGPSVPRAVNDDT